MFWKGHEKYEELLKEISKYDIEAYDPRPKQKDLLKTLGLRRKELIDLMREMYEDFYLGISRDGTYPEAQYYLGGMFLEGRGVQKNIEKGIELLFKAAEQGFALAQSEVGLLYTEGRGVSQDYKLAMEWFTKAFEQDVAVAQYNLGALYFKGGSSFSG